MRIDKIDERDALRSLLEIKDSQIRISMLQQAYAAADHSIHIGGCMSATLPLIALFYSGYARFDPLNPTAEGQDMFLLSKGHAAALLASIYADLGYFDKSHLIGTRSDGSIVNGHPGPVMPGVHAASGPLGQGVSVALGFALAGKNGRCFDSFCLAGDGELQEGNTWEAILYAGSQKVDNLCLLVDRNNGQVDKIDRLVVDFDLASVFRAFGWNVFNVNGMEYLPVVDAIASFKCGARDGKPTVIICNSFKGFGGFTESMNKHKVKLDEQTYAQEIALQKRRLMHRKVAYDQALMRIKTKEQRDAIEEMAQQMQISETDDRQMDRPHACQRAAVRSKAIQYDPASLPVLDPGQQYQMAKVVSMVMRAFAADPKVVSVDSDLSGISGLAPGVRQTDQFRAINVGVAESNMSGIAEGYAALGYNVWNSTFCPFFDLRVLRRIAISYQERQEAIDRGLWLAKGHNLDITFLATAANFDTAANGATHMGNDDLLMLRELAHVSIIDVSCPNQLIGVMRWIAEGEKGLVYVRILRAASDVLYPSGFCFEYGKGYVLRKHEKDVAVLVASGRSTHECLKAADLLEKEGCCVRVIDMPSFDYALLAQMNEQKLPIIFAEQNNGYLWTCFKSKVFGETGWLSPCYPINCTASSGVKRFIHSGTYDQLVKRYGLEAHQLKDFVKSVVLRVV